MPSEQSPVIYLIGGPNGAGKTTFAREFLPSRVREFLNADLIAAGLSPLDPAAAAIPAARLLLTRLRDLLAAKTSFAVESTLSGRTYLNTLRDAKEAGYTITLTYLWLPSADFSRRRVGQRVRHGGHHVPTPDVQRRYLPSVRNFFELYLPLADDTFLFEAAKQPPPLVASWHGTSLSIAKPEVYEHIRAQVQHAGGT